jgi:hypothetical protein
MIKFKEFSTKKDSDIDEQLTNFVNIRNIRIIDIKYQVFLDTSNNVLMSFALLEYEDLSEYKQSYALTEDEVGV